jgi:hypothetical protein
LTYSANLDRNTSRLKRLKRGTRYEHGQEKETRKMTGTKTEKGRIRKEKGDIDRKSKARKIQQENRWGSERHEQGTDKKQDHRKWK